MTQNQGQPIFILPEGTTRTVGRDAQRNNIMAARLVAETVRTTLGPKGMDKMIVDSVGDITITNDGVTILEEMQIEHPAAKMIVEVAKTQEDEVGDGTTTAVILAGELLKNAEGLLDQNIHPTIIARGYREAAEKAHELLKAMATKTDVNDTETLKKIAMTAMTGKGAERCKELLADIAVKGVQQVIENNIFDIDMVKLEKKVGGSIEDSELITGIVLDKEAVHPSMPKKLTDAKIALLDVAIEIKKAETDAKIEITKPSQIEAFLKQEEDMLRKMTDKIVASGVTVLICQKGIDDLAQHFLAKAGVYACRRVKKSDMEKLSKATGAMIVTNIGDLESKDLGYAGVVEEVKVGDEDMTYIKDCKNPKAVTLLVRGGTQHVVDEVERALKDALGDIGAALKTGDVCYGAGATEMQLSIGLRQFANTLSGREQLAVNAFADATEIIPRTLAENAGLDPIDIITELKAAHDKGDTRMGINVFTGKLMDARKEGILEPLKIKTQAVSSASEVAELILRIDDVIAGNAKPRGGDTPMHGMDM